MSGLQQKVEDLLQILFPKVLCVYAVFEFPYLVSLPFLRVHQLNWLFLFFSEDLKQTESNGLLHDSGYDSGE